MGPLNLSSPQPQPSIPTPPNPPTHTHTHLPTHPDHPTSPQVLEELGKGGKYQVPDDFPYQEARRLFKGGCLPRPACSPRAARVASGQPACAAFPAERALPLKASSSKGPSTLGCTSRGLATPARACCLRDASLPTNGGLP